MYTVLETHQQYTNFITEDFQTEIHRLNTQLCSLKDRFKKIKILNIETINEEAIENKLDLAFDYYILCLYDNSLQRKATDKKFMEHYESLVLGLNGGADLLKKLKMTFNEIKNPVNEIKNPVNIYVFRRHLKHLKRDFFCSHLLKLYGSTRSLNDAINNIISLKKYFSGKKDEDNKEFDKVIHDKTDVLVESFFA